MNETTPSASTSPIRESLINVEGLVVKIHPDHIRHLQEVADAHALRIQQTKSNPTYVEDEFSRRLLAPRDINVYGEVDYLPPHAPALAQKYLQPGARVGIRTAMPAEQIKELMYMPPLSVMIRENNQDPAQPTLLAQEITDPRLPCVIDGTTQFNERSRAVTHMMCGSSAPMPCQTCQCPRKAVTPQP